MQFSQALVGYPREPRPPCRAETSACHLPVSITCRDTRQSRLQGRGRLQRGSPMQWGGTAWGCRSPVTRPLQPPSPSLLAGAPRGSGRLAQERGGHVGDGGEKEDVRCCQVPHGPVRGRGPALRPLRCPLQHPRSALGAGQMQKPPPPITEKGVACPISHPTRGTGACPARPRCAAPASSHPALPACPPQPSGVCCPHHAHPVQRGCRWHQLWAAESGRKTLLPHCSALFLSHRGIRKKTPPTPACLPFPRCPSVLFTPLP